MNARPVTSFIRQTHRKTTDRQTDKQTDDRQTDNRQIFFCTFRVLGVKNVQKKSFSSIGRKISFGTVALMSFGTPDI